MNIELLRFCPRRPDGHLRMILFDHCPCGPGRWWFAWFKDDGIAAPHGEGPSAKMALIELLNDAS